MLLREKTIMVVFLSLAITTTKFSGALVPKPTDSNSGVKKTAKPAAKSTVVSPFIHKFETFKLPPPPPLAELAAVLRAALPRNYAQVSVTVQVPPDLTAAPFKLSRPGLSGGQQAIVNVGSVQYAYENVSSENRYDFLQLAEQLRLYGHQFTGTGSGPYFQLGHKAEMVADIFIPKRYKKHPELIRNEGHFTDYDSSKNISHVYKYSTYLPRLTLPTVADKRTTEFVNLATLYASAGDGDVPVLTVHVARRNGTDANFLNFVQKALAAHYKKTNSTTVVALGTVFLVKNNSSRADASKSAIKTYVKYNEDTKAHLDVPVPLICAGTLISQPKPEWADHKQHAHCYGPHGGGNYLTEAGSGDNVEYVAYFQTANIIYRVHRPIPPPRPPLPARPIAKKSKTKNIK